MSTYPGVPKEMVEIGTLVPGGSRRGERAPLIGLSGIRRHRLLAVENSTMRAGGGSSPPPMTAPTVAMACSAVKMPSPVAVRSASCSCRSPPWWRRDWWWVRRDGRSSGVGDQPEVDARGQFLGELLGRLLGRQPGWVRRRWPTSIATRRSRASRPRGLRRMRQIIGQPGHRDGEHCQGGDERMAGGGVATGWVV